MRKKELVIVPKFEGTDNRDIGKTFQLNEWDAETGEKWAIAMVLAFNRSAGEIPMDLRGIGWEGIAILSINTFLRGNIQAEEIIPLLDKLLDCVKIVRDPKHPDIATEIVSADDIEEVATRLWLRSEVLRLHTNFSPIAVLSALISAIMTKRPDSSTT